jgi:hypothetical protein
MVTPSVPALFESHFLPLYPPDAQAGLDRARAVDANPGHNPTPLAHLRDAAERFVARAPYLFGPGIELDFDDASVHRLSAGLTPERIAALRQAGAAGTAENELFNLAVHGAAYVGECIVRRHGGRWSVRRPLWESLVHLVSPAGDGELAVFHWWLKALANDPAGVTLADRYRAHVEVPCAHPETWSPVCEADRNLPRLTKGIRYDVLYKHLKAHLPEIKDLGDFPSPERFAELDFRTMDFLVLGGGRMILVAAHGRAGLHLFWLGARGFEKSVFFPADAFPAPVVRKAGERLEVLLSADGRTQRHEMLWWGP